MLRHRINRRGFQLNRPLRRQCAVLICLLALPSSLLVDMGHAIGTGPATYQTTGTPAPLWLGQKITDSSFETGIAPWTELDYNNYTPRVQTMMIVHPGYNDNSAVQLTVNSGNLTTDSHVTLMQDFSKSPVAFGKGLALRASFQIGLIQGNTITDRVEISITLVTSVGGENRIHYVIGTGSAPPANSTSDAYITVPGTVSNAWTLFYRNIATDASSAFPTIFPSISSLKDVRLSVYSTSQSTPTYDPRIKYIDTDSDGFWNITGTGTGTTSETVVFHPGTGSTYDVNQDKLLYNASGTPPANGTPLSNDPWIKYIDKNLNGQWDTGEPIVYDWHHDGIYEGSGSPSDPTICGAPPYCSPPIVGSLLQDPVRKQTMATFDQVELYSSSGNYDQVLNGGFETGTLASWGNTAGFNTATTPTHSGSYSAAGTAASSTIDLAQSIDGEPLLDTSLHLQASAYVGGMSGATGSDKVDIWVGLVDSSPNANPLSIYYYFKTGTGSLPTNTTDTINHQTIGFGSLAQWLSLNQTLVNDSGYFTNMGYVAPYRVQTIALEAAAQSGSTTTAYFDDISMLTLYTPAPATSKYYAADGLNSTYAYTANRIPQTQFTLALPSQQSILNITSPSGTVVPQNGYSAQVVSGALLVTVANSTTTNYPVYSNWRLYTTSKNTLASLYATPTGSETSSTAFDPGSTVRIVTRTTDPSGVPIAGANITILVYSSNTQAFNGHTNSQGWYNQTGLVLPETPGKLSIEAITVSSSYIGLRSAQLTVNTPFPWTLVIYATIAAVALALFGLFYFRSRRKKTNNPQPITPPSTPAKKNTPSKR